MFGLGFSEIIVILAVAIIFVGPDKLPELAQRIGRLVWQFKHSAEELRKELTLPDYTSEKNSLQKEFQEIKNSILKEEPQEANKK